MNFIGANNFWLVDGTSIFVWGLKISKARKQEILNDKTIQLYKSKIRGFNENKQLEFYLLKEPVVEYSEELNLKLPK